MMSRPDLAARLKALAHPARLKVLETLAGREGCACGEIVAGLPLAQSTVSQHIKILAEAGLVRGGMDGQRPCYCIDGQALESLRRDIDALLSRLASGPGGAACGPHSQG
ncbi:MAG: hypothetical protein B7Y75_00420 [Azorhizobium sp. 35-67-5]|nr:MAG: hypothetical protein B7Z30_10580 [Rhizobiales bacterium 12-68-15]OYX88561.1 MAG: hypothetical protein B7Y75_00420 [Azorhizobium sp. 35-67-5]OZA78042.1 MAG: hypothetical protein B7X76_10265 [Azorhizobium sp. 39-67-5]